MPQINTSDRKSNYTKLAVLAAGVGMLCVGSLWLWTAAFGTYHNTDDFLGTSTEALFNNTLVVTVLVSLVMMLTRQSEIGFVRRLFHSLLSMSVCGVSLTYLFIRFGDLNTTSQDELYAGRDHSMLFGLVLGGAIAVSGIASLAKSRRELRERFTDLPAFDEQ